MGPNDDAASRIRGAVHSGDARRDVLRRSAAAGSLASLAVFGIGACGKDKHVSVSCEDTTGLPPDAVALRTSPAVAYADRSTDPVKTCARCQHFLPAPSEAACGACKVLKGPISAQGSCRLFVPRMA